MLNKKEIWTNRGTWLVARLLFPENVFFLSLSCGRNWNSYFFFNQAQTDCVCPTHSRVWCVPGWWWILSIFTSTASQHCCPHPHLVMVSLSFWSSCALRLLGGAVGASWFNGLQYVCSLDSANELQGPPQGWGAGREAESWSLQSLSHAITMYPTSTSYRRKDSHSQFLRFQPASLGSVLLASEAEHPVHRSVRRRLGRKCSSSWWKWSRRLALVQRKAHIRH